MFVNTSSQSSLFVPYRRDGEKLKKLKHLPLYDLAVDPDSGQAAVWAESVPQYVVPAPAAEAE